ncbi:response regulator [Paenibacillus sacheonensis]|uniref:Response regulator n=1 Tax=Paenibacillus sacheonensis TaxID=742054 RepID=A0A7X5BY00_9BACL|nr:response regulator [Paenibacillus sacheonensis]MBM7563663.1 two-component system response regulator YesN [Paenibacillus sacheonensis]NBC71043.1 response regulator [Paenibacillus sacheonensis]
MLKMIIADDEYNVREGLKEVVRWEELGIEVVGDAADGLETFELCSRLRPDILLTDIRMPMMDGLEAALKLKESGNPVRVIIISGAEDFNYAKTALSLNADGYILKPVKIPELQQIVRKVVASISLERSRETRTEQLQRQIHENMPLLREKFLSQVALGMHANEEDVRHKLAEYGMPASNEDLWTAAVLQIDEYEKAIERYSDTRKQLLGFSVNNILDEIVSRGGSGGVFSMNENEHVILFIQTKSRQQTSPEELAREMTDSIRSYLKLSASVGIGNPVRQAIELNGSYQEALAALKYKFYTGKGSVLSIGDFQADAHPLEFPKLFDAETKLINFMKLGSKEEAADTVNAIFEALCDNRHLPIGYMQSICVELIHMADKAIGEMDENIRDIVPGYASAFVDVYDKREAAELREAMLELFGGLADYFVHRHSPKNNRIIQQIKTIISQSYMDNITVARLSEQVYLSPNYISLIFKQETGESITEYVTKVRMEAAKELLKSQDLKILEVAEMVGYENATYFSTVFKKFTGMHPQKYRGLFQAHG